MDTHAEKHHVDQLERDSVDGRRSHHSGLGAHAYAAEAESLPKGYFYSPYFLGTMTAVGFNLMVSASSLLFGSGSRTCLDLAETSKSFGGLLLCVTPWHRYPITL